MPLSFIDLYMLKVCLFKSVAISRPMKNLPVSNSCNNHISLPNTLSLLAVDLVMSIDLSTDFNASRSLPSSSFSSPSYPLTSQLALELAMALLAHFRLVFELPMGDWKNADDEVDDEGGDDGEEQETR